LEPQSGAPAPEVRTQLKRLLDVDRSLGRDRRSRDPERANYAFYNDRPPGSGVEVWFSEYEAFALLNGLRLMRHGLPQTFAVEVMRCVRPELENQHARILKQDPKSLFDQEEIYRGASLGAMGFDNADPVLLVIAGRSEAISEKGAPTAYGVCRGEKEAAKFAKDHVLAGRGWTMFEMATPAHLLAKALANTEPRRRGR
jgi:hypothetical protein